MGQTNVTTACFLHYRHLHCQEATLAAVAACFVDLVHFHRPGWRSVGVFDHAHLILAWVEVWVHCHRLGWVLAGTLDLARLIPA